MSRDLNKRELDVLRSLDDEIWVRPMEVGGSDGSHHSTTLARLARRGLVERHKSCHCGPGSWREKELLAKGITPRWPWCACKGSCRYRRTPAGHLAVLPTHEHLCAACKGDGFERDDDGVFRAWNDCQTCGGDGRHLDERER